MRKGLSGGAQVRIGPVCNRERRPIAGHIDLEAGMERVTDH